MTALIPGRWLAVALALLCAPGCLLEELDRSLLDAGRDDADGEGDLGDADGGDVDADGGETDGDGVGPPVCGNSRRDPGEPCERGESVSCSSTCGDSGGRRTCEDDCIWGPCVFPTTPEWCNHLDDDGDTRTDECVWCPDDFSDFGGLYGVALAADGGVWAVGEGTGGSGTPEALRREPATGEWSHEISGLVGELHAIATRGSDIWVAGTSGFVYHREGTSWAGVGTAISGQPLEGLFAFDPADLWVVGENVETVGTAVIQQWNGTVWQRFDPLDSMWRDFYAIDGHPESSTVWAVGSDGSVFRHLPGDLTTIGGAPSLQGIHARNANDVWAVGGVIDRGVVYRSDGSVWTELWTPPGQPFTDVWVSADGSHAWVVRGVGAEILHWSTGEGWERARAPSGLQGLHAIVGDAATGEIWAVGDLILRWRI